MNKQELKNNLIGMSMLIYFMGSSILGAAIGYFIFPSLKLTFEFMILSGLICFLLSGMFYEKAFHIIDLSCNKCYNKLHKQKIKQMEFKKENFINTCILSDLPEDGPKIVKFYKDLGFDTSDFSGNCSKSKNSMCTYYGIFDGHFSLSYGPTDTLLPISIIDEYYESLKQKDVFEKDQYIVSLCNHSASFIKNHIYKQREKHNYLRPYYDSKGYTDNGYSGVFIKDKTSFRYPTAEEIAEYDRLGKPYDTTTLNMKKPLFEPKFEIGDRVVYKGNIGTVVSYWGDYSHKNTTTGVLFDESGLFLLPSSYKNQIDKFGNKITHDEKGYTFRNCQECDLTIYTEAVTAQVETPKRNLDEVLAECKKRFPIGSKYKCANNNHGEGSNIWTVRDYRVLNLTGTWGIYSGNGWVFLNGKYAEPVSDEYICKPFPETDYVKLRIVKDINRKDLGTPGQIKETIPVGSITWVCIAYYNNQKLDNTVHPENNKWKANIPSEYFEIIEIVNLQNNVLKTETVEKPFYNIEPKKGYYIKCVENYLDRNIAGKYYRIISLNNIFEDISDCIEIEGIGGYGKGYWEKYFDPQSICEFNPDEIRNQGDFIYQNVTVDSLKSVLQDFTLTDVSKFNIPTINFIESDDFIPATITKSKPLELINLVD